MSLKQLQQQFAKQRDKQRTLSDQWQRSRETLRSLAAEKARLQRQGKQDSNQYAQLLAREAENSKAITQLEKQLKTEQDSYASLIGQLHELPPQQMVTQLDDSIPVLMFPVRLETRFNNADGVNQLWLRIYPDDINVAVQKTPPARG